MNKSQAQKAIAVLNPEDVVLTHVESTVWKIRKADGSLYRARFSEVKRGEQVPEVIEILPQPEPKAKKQPKAEETAEATEQAPQTPRRRRTSSQRNDR